MIEIDLEGTSEAVQYIGLVSGALSDMTPIWEGLIRPVMLSQLKIRGAPDLYGIAQQSLGAVPLVEPRYTLEGSVAEAFANGGRNAYRSRAWRGYDAEPIYAAYKLEAGGGTRILLWDGSGDPLIDTFLDANHEDHVEITEPERMSWGSSRDYAADLHEGGFWQPWDKMRPDARPILPPAQPAGFRLAKGVQRMVVEMAKASGQSPGAVLAGMRDFPTPGGSGGGGGRRRDARGRFI